MIWILYSFNFSLPKFSLKTEDKPSFDARHKGQENKSSRVSRDEPEERPEFGQPVSRSLIKSLLKDKIERKIEAKEREKKIRPTINFSGEKPTFPIALMESSADQTVTIDETFLMEKAKALQDKLMEFNVPIMIE